VTGNFFFLLHWWLVTFLHKNRRTSATGDFFLRSISHRIIYIAVHNLLWSFPNVYWRFEIINIYPLFNMIIFLSDLKVIYYTEFLENCNIIMIFYVFYVNWIVQVLVLPGNNEYNRQGYPFQIIFFKNIIASSRIYTGFCPKRLSNCRLALWSKGAPDIESN
jgi:hypothetical protein